MNLEIHVVGLIINRLRKSNSVNKNLTDSIRCHVNANKIEIHVTFNIYIYIYIYINIKYINI
jgi:hypothetical protein